MNNETQGQTVSTRVELPWFILLYGLDGLLEQVQLVNDKKLRRLFDELEKYIETRLFEKRGDIVDTYVIFEQQRNE